MIIIDYEQNSQAWQEWRAGVYGASDAAAMLDISPYKSRDALLHEKATGKSAPVSDWLQQLFAAGHAAEAAIMPELEARVGEPLYNLVGETDNHIAASFDGITYDQQTIVEHKLLRNSNASRKRFDNSNCWYRARRGVSSVSRTARRSASPSPKSNPTPNGSCASSRAGNNSPPTSPPTPQTAKTPPFSKPPPHGVPSRHNRQKSKKPKKRRGNTSKHWAKRAAKKS